MSRITSCLVVLTIGWAIALAPGDARAEINLPAGEVSTSLFDGVSFAGWQGLTDKYWSIEDGMIVAKNDQPNPASTYLLTKKSYRNFRLLLDVRQTTGKKYSTMHSAVCCLGEIIEDAGQAFGFRGPLLMFCQDWGMWDAHGRNRVFPSGHGGPYHPDLENVGEWNQIEILVLGNRIRVAANGQFVMDFIDTAERLKSSPIGLQLHGNRQPQEYHFRNLLLVEDPTDAMATIPDADLLTTAPSNVGMSSDKLSEIDGLMQQSIDEHAIAGGVVMIARDGKVVLQRAYGKRDIGEDQPMQDDTIFRIYSMSKAITTAAAMMLVEEGRLGIEDPVAKYLPELAHVQVIDGDSTRPAKQTMTIADLMRHTSGYSYGDAGVAAYDDAFRNLGLLDRDVSSKEFQSRLADLPLLFEPGTDWHYGISTDVLGRVVEVASGLSLDEFFQTRIFAPLKMVDTGFWVPPNKVDRFAANYSRDKSGNLTILDAPQTSRYLAKPAFCSGGGGLVSTASDYMRFLLMIDGGGQLGDVRLLREETVALMTRNQLPQDVGWIKFGKEVRTGVGFGFGFCVREQMSDWDPDGRVGEYGWGGAASTHYWISPQDRIVVVTLEQIMPYQWLTEFKLKDTIYDAIDAPANAK
tara:strand:+ start:211 stop:2112 length:1902 start_codon:yes stop_codon:yes gene_type:complete